MNKLITILLVIIMLLSITACSSGNEAPTDPDERLVLGDRMGWDLSFDKGFIWYSFQSDGSYHYVDATATRTSGSGEGTWKTNKGVLTLSDGTQYIYSLRGDTLILKDASGDEHECKPMGEPIID